MLAMNSAIPCNDIIACLFYLISWVCINCRQKLFSSTISCGFVAGEHYIKLMRIKLSNREWPFLQILAMARLPQFD